MVDAVRLERQHLWNLASGSARTEIPLKALKKCMFKSCLNLTL